MAEEAKTKNKKPVVIIIIHSRSPLEELEALHLNLPRGRFVFFWLK